MLRVFYVFITFLSLTLSGYAQQKEELTKFVQSAMDNLEIIPAISVAVAGEDGILYAGGFGVANIETGEKVTEKTNFYIASTSKAFTGLLMTMLADEGKVDLSAEILNYRPFSEFEEQDLFRGVTVQDLLSHTGGIDNPYLSFKLAFSGDYTEEGILELVERASENLGNGKAFEYTNYGYYLIALLIKEEFGEDWRDLIDERVFSPFGMESTTAYVSKSPQRTAPHVGLDQDRVEVARFKTDETMHAAGGLLLNADTLNWNGEIFVRQP